MQYEPIYIYDYIQIYQYICYQLLTNLFSLLNELNELII